MALGEVLLTDAQWAKIQPLLPQWMLLVDGQGLPVACRTASASPAEVTLVEDLTAQVSVEDGPVPLIADRAYDSDPHRARLKEQGFDLACPLRFRRRRSLS